MVDKQKNLEEHAKKNTNPLLFIAGLFILGLALALLLFGGRLLENRGSSAESSDLPQIPSLSGVNREGVPLPQSGAPLNVGDPAHNFSLEDLNGNQVALSDFTGRPVIVNFWATWCAPCRLEMPAFQRVFDANKDKGLVILAVNEGELPDKVNDFFYEELGFTYTPLLDSQTDVGNAYGAVGLPSTFFIDTEGRVSAVHRGVMTEGQIESYLEEILR